MDQALTLPKYDTLTCEPEILHGTVEFHCRVCGVGTLLKSASDSLRCCVLSLGQRLHRSFGCRGAQFAETLLLLAVLAMVAVVSMLITFPAKIIVINNDIIVAMVVLRLWLLPLLALFAVHHNDKS